MPARIAYLTAGAGGMFCGSCLHDNALAKALGQLGWDVSLIPLYTPIRTDEQDQSVDQVFFGGINVYLQQKIPLFRHLPRFLDRFLDNPRLIRRVTSKAIEVDASKLGDLTLSVLQGSDGNQRKEVKRLIEWLGDSARPNLIVVTNMLVAGFAREWRRTHSAPVLVTLQGDDLFLSGRPRQWREKCLAEIRRIDPVVAGYLVHSRAYADLMSEFLGLPRDKMQVTPLGIDTADFQHLPPRPAPDGVFRVGYFARLAKEKGLHQLVDAFLALRQLPGTDCVRLELAGWKSPEAEAFVESQFERLRQAGLGSAFTYHGVLDRRAKLDFLQRVDLLSVPTEQAEPKGLFVLEALAAGTPVVQPAIGAFPEMLESSGGGILVPPANPQALAAAWWELLHAPDKLRELGARGREYVLTQRSGAQMAASTADVLERFLGQG
ncbi:MAG: glycosyltransferase family 4 protein [Blastopirellula sp.]|nr:glycosyltransferase family 4 protein [Blastopirellula sp.]